MDQPRANGLVEYYNASIKAVIWWLCSILLGAEWYTVLFDVITGLWFLPTHLGFSLYILCFKEEPVWHGKFGGRAGLVEVGNLSELHLDE